MTRWVNFIENNLHEHELQLSDLKNLYQTENTLSGARFCELLPDWSKTLFGPQDIVSGHKVKKSALTHTPRLSQ